MANNSFRLDFIFHTRFIEKFKSLKIFNAIEKMKQGQPSEMSIQAYLAEIGLLRELALLKKEFDKPTHRKLMKEDKLMADYYQVINKSYHFLQKYYPELLIKETQTRFLYDQTKTYQSLNRESLYQFFNDLVSTKLTFEKRNKPTLK